MAVWEVCSSFTALRQELAASQHFGKGLQEGLVLLAGAVGDAQRAGAPQRASPAHEHAALLQAAHDLLLALARLLLAATVAEVEPAKVGLRVGRVQPQGTQALVH